MYSILRIFVFSGSLVSSLAFAMYIDDQLYEGNECRLESGAQGVCKKLPECPVRLAEVREGRRSSEPSGRCGFENFVEIVCCPLNFPDKLGLRAAEVACEEYDNEILIDNSKEDGIGFNIFGGTEAQSGEFPYMVALGYNNSEAVAEGATTAAPSIRYSCGGTLISDQHVLTAAHCVSNINERVPIEVRLGAEDLRTNSPSVQRIAISEIVSHPRYKRSANYNDLAILKLKQRVQFNTKVKPICLQTKSVASLNMTGNSTLVVIGWGSTSFDDDGSSKLMRTPSLSLVERKTCSKSYEGFLKLPNGLDENMLCAVDRNTSRQADACQGDSGGPLLMLSASGDTIVGITAFGQTCGGTIPGVYMAIHPYLDWIEQQVWEEGDARVPEPEPNDDDEEDEREHGHIHIFVNGVSHGHGHGFVTRN